MRCDEVSRLLDAYLDTELPEEVMNRMDRHLLRCQACAFEVRSLEQTRAMLCEAADSDELSPAFRERTAARLLDAFAAHLQPAPDADANRQWKLPFG